MTDPSLADARRNAGHIWSLDSGRFSVKLFVPYEQTSTHFCQVLQVKVSQQYQDASVSLQRDFGMLKLALLLLLAGIALPAVAARNVTVEQLEQVMAAAHGKADAKLAQQFSGWNSPSG